MARQAEVAKVIWLANRQAVSLQTDRELLSLHIAGDETAFATLVARHSGMVFGVCRRLLPTHQDAEDASQATFLVLAQKAPSTRWQPSIANWLYTTAWQIATKANRSLAKRAHQPSTDPENEATCLLDQMSWREGLCILDEELAKLPSRYREPLVLCYLEGLTRDEAATRLTIPAETVKTRLDRGRKRLHAALTRRGLVGSVGLLAVETLSTASMPQLAGSILATIKDPSPAIAQLAKGIAENLSIKKAVLISVAFLGLTTLGTTTFLLRTNSEPLPQQPIAQAHPDPLPQQPIAPVEPPKITLKKQAEPEVPKERVITGKVIGPDERPIAGAELYTFVSKSPGKRPEWEGDSISKRVGVTSSEGKFQVTINGGMTNEYLIVHQEGFGIGWQEILPLVIERDQSVTIRLPKDAPITGRLVDGDGKPVADAIVRLKQLSNIDEQGVASILQKMQQQVSYYPSPDVILCDRGNQVQADAQGRFTLASAGAGRLAQIQFEGNGLVTTTAYVFTGPRFNPKPYNALIASQIENSLRRYLRGLA